ncbi:MAG: permease-like cell division protein FtsX [Bacteroidota bacterium]
MESIKRYLRILGFIAEEAVASLKRSGWMSWVVIGTMAASLTILGGFWMLTDDLNLLAKAIGSKVEIMVFLKDDASIQALESDIRALPGVDSITVVSKDDAWKTLQKDLKTSMRFDNLLETNPLPNALKIKVVDPKDTPQLADKISVMPGVEELNYGKELLKKIQQAAGFLRFIGIAITALLSVATLAVMSNTIRLTVQNRRREIEIMQLVGASDGFIRWPFLLEGVFFGLAGAVFTGMILAVWRTFFFARLQEMFPFIPIQEGSFSTVKVVGYILAIGVGMGAFGSLFSVKHYLKQQN